MLPDKGNHMGQTPTRSDAAEPPVTGRAETPAAASEAFRLGIKGQPTEAAPEETPAARKALEQRRTALFGG